MSPGRIDSGALRTSARIIGTMPLVLFLTVMLVPVDCSLENSGYKSTITGRVVDSLGKPKEGVMVVARQGQEVSTTEEARTRYYWGGIPKRAYTNSDGIFALEIDWEEGTFVGTLLDRPESLGIDYLPCIQWMDVRHGNTYNISFEIVPGASLILDLDDVSFVESTEPQEVTTLLEVIPLVHTAESNISIMRTNWDTYHYVLGLSPGNVTIPAGCQVRVRIEATTRVPESRYRGPGAEKYYRYVTQSLMINEPFNLSKGEMMEIDLRPYSIKCNLNVTKTFLCSVSRLVGEFEAKGLYLFKEKQGLDAAEFFVGISEANYAEGEFRESYANMKQAYIMSREIVERISDMEKDASFGTLLLIPLLAVNALLIAFLCTENKSLKTLLFLLLFAGLTGVMSLAYVGFRLTETHLVEADALLSVVVCTVFTHLTLKGEGGNRERLSVAGAVSMAFSIAKRNLRKRRLRTFLVVSSMIVMVFAFVSLTSFDIGYGFMVRPVSGTAPRLGMFVQRSPPLEQAGSVPFLPLGISVIEWLNNQEETEVIAPKAQNELRSIDQTSYLFFLSSPNGYRIGIFGIIGIVPSSESQVTSINKIVREGRFLNDADSDGVMLSAATAESLGLQPNDSITILENQFRLVGTFNEASLEKLTDLDGASMLPKVKTGEYWALCSSKQVAIFTFPTALKFPFVVLARVDVLANSPSQIPNLARATVFSLAADVWVSLSDGIHRYHVGQSLEIQGGILAVPVLLVLGNVFSFTTNSVYERKKEVSIMSTLGLTPTHVTAIFVAEGLIASFISGGVGYLLGLGTYRLLSILPSQLEVVPKVSVGWGFLALLFSAVVTLLGVTVPALRASLMTTPSLARKWGLDETTQKHGDHWRIHLPVFVPEANINPFFSHILHKLRYYEKSTLQTVKNLSIKQKERELSFTFCGYTDEGPSEEIVVENTVVIVPSEKNGFVTVYYMYRGTRVGGRMLFREQHAHGMASLLRRIVFTYENLSAREKK